MRLSALVTLLVTAATAGAADWYNWRGPFDNGVSPEKNLPASWSPDGENLVWKAPYGSRSTPLILNGRVYFINYTAEKLKDASGDVTDKTETIQERVMCLDADTGKFLWEYNFNVWHTDIVTVRLGWTNIAADPKTGNIYAHGTQGMLLCLDKDGKLVWSRSLSEEYGRISGYGGRLCSPIVDGDLVIIGMNNSAWGDLAKGGNRFIAFNKNTGDAVWWSDPAGRVLDSYYSVPVVATINGQRQMITGCSDGSVVGVQVATGKKLWRYVFSAAAINTSPVVDGNLVYVSHGEENPDNNIKGRIICLDASQIDKDGEPKLVWKKDGVKARWCSPILHEGRLYYADELAKLYCFDAKTGKQQWKYSYGRNARGSPVLADGKIYVGEVNSRFHILKPEDKKCVALHEHYFTGDGFADVEINGSPAVANGRVYFATNDEFYCIGVKGAKPAPEPKVETAPAKRKAEIAQVQIVPADVVLHPGDKATFQVKVFDEAGNESDLSAVLIKPKWSLPTPKAPPGAKTSPPPLDGTLNDNTLVVSAKKANQAGYVQVQLGDVMGKARVRVAPVLPYEQDFSKVPDGAVPGGWVNTQGKFLVKTVDGEKVLAKVNNNAVPFIAGGNAYIGEPTLKDYTIEADVRGSKAGVLPDMGIGAHRYTLLLDGKSQGLRILSWDALPRVDTTRPFEIKPDTWYRLKLTVEIKGKEGIVKGKAWERGSPEPKEWLELRDPRPNTEGAPALYGYVRGIVEGQPGTDIYYDNVRITPNNK
jgi:outer membrane protein assembly factor BamB